MSLSKNEIYYTLIKYKQDAMLEKVKALNENEIAQISINSTKLNVKNFKTRDKKIVLAVLQFFGITPEHKFELPLGVTELNHKYHAYINE